MTTTTAEIRLHPGGIRTLHLGDGLTLTRAMARQLDRLDCYGYPLGRIEPLGRIRTGIKVECERELRGRPDPVTAAHFSESGSWYERIKVHPYLELIGRDVETDTLTVWVLDAWHEYVRYCDGEHNADERAAVAHAGDTLPLIVLP